MSNTLRVYLPLGDSGKPMNVSSFVGGKYGYSVQFTIDGHYCALAENQVRDLITTLQKRLRSVKKYQATQIDLNKHIFPRGKVTNG